MRTGFQFFLILMLTACSTTDSSTPMEQAYCNAFKTWIHAVPESEADERHVTLFQAGCGEGRICMYSLGWNTECEACDDAADEAFVEAVAPLTHYVSIDELAEYSVACLSSRHAIKIDVLDENARPQSASEIYRGATVDINWERSDCGFYGCTTLRVSYK
jgi:hypothetical protein